MLDPNLNIWMLLLCTYVLYGLGYVLGFVQDMDEDNKPGPIWFCVAVIGLTLVWPFVKGIIDGQEDGMAQP